VHWRWIALMDFGLAAFNLFIAWWVWNWVSLMNLAAAVVCTAFGLYTRHQYTKHLANLAEEARIQYLRDNFPWN